MGSQGRPETAPLGSDGLVEALRGDASSFDFFQAVRLLRLLESHREEVGGFAPPPEEAVRFSTSPDLAFPAGEIKELSERAGGQPWMEVNFMGLVGNSGVLPLHYSRLVLSEEKQGKKGLRDFLDIFQHRLISLFYRAWEKGRFFVPFERGEEDPVSDRLLEMIGLGNRHLRGQVGVPDEDLLFYAGILGIQQRSAVGLERMIGDYLEVPVEVQQFIGCWYPVSEDSQCRIDDEVSEFSPRLGEHTVVGGEIWDPQARVRIRIGPLPRARYDGFLPGGEAHRKLKAITTFFGDGQFDFEAQIVLAKEDVPPVVLGGEDAEGTPLGWCSWIRTRSFERDADETTLTL